MIEHGATFAEWDITDQDAGILCIGPLHALDLLFFDIMLPKYCVRAGLYGVMTRVFFISSFFSPNKNTEECSKTNLSPPPSRDGRKPLHLVSSLGSLDCARLLLEAGGRPLFQGWDGSTVFAKSWPGLGNQPYLRAVFVGGLRVKDSNLVSWLAATTTSIHMQSINIHYTYCFESRDLKLDHKCTGERQACVR